MRIDKLLADAGWGTRKEVKQLLASGQVSLGTNVIKSAKFQIAASDLANLQIAGAAWQKEQQAPIFMLHKPLGVLSASVDQTAPCALDFLPQVYQTRNYSCVGRLDKNSEGLLLLTNDGQLIHRLTQPKWQIPKVYAIEFTPALTKEQALNLPAIFAAGVVLKEFTCLPAELKIETAKSALITVKEGKFHQVRRMFAAFGLEVTRLLRLKEGSLSLGNLQSGEIRPLSLEEVASLYTEVNLSIPALMV